ncbi:hypothetical protein AJ79_06847 [Helicocarpus griseus UAMH5409]|uniref:Uncharacterized protein n=1 Tax=Helicocarpus griseus UAMH5409 TaxID=1447875 RepID=A0A2B7X843_9EURO|nr:hypothetical protein AJ79_06847 [Helicocarpus griseus UAMH5409]
MPVRPSPVQGIPTIQKSRRRLGNLFSNLSKLINKNKGKSKKKKDPKKDDSKKKESKKKESKKKESKKKGSKKKDSKNKDSKKTPKKGDPKTKDPKKDPQKQDPKKKDPKKKDPKKKDPKKKDPKKENDPPRDSCPVNNGGKKGKKGKRDKGGNGGNGSKGSNSNCVSCGSVKIWKPDEVKALEALLNNKQRNKREVPLNISEQSVGLEKRGSKKVNFCGAFSGGIKLRRLYDSRSGLVTKLKNRGLDKNRILTAMNPEQCDDFAIKVQDLSADSKSPKSTKNNDLALETEHVIEAQVISRFFDEEMYKEGEDNFCDPYNAGKAVDFCTHFVGFWHHTPRGFVQGVKDTPSEEIAKQLPGTDEFVEEFLLFPAAANKAKANAWGNTGAILIEKKMPDLIKADDFKDDIERSKMLEAIVKFKSVMWSYQYQTTKEFKDILEKQATRLGKKLGELDDKLDRAQFTGQTSTGKGQRTYAQDYTRLGLEEKWNIWLRKVNGQAISNTNRYFKNVVPVFTRRLEELEAESKKAGLSQTQKDNYKIVIGYVKKLIQEYKKMRQTKWENVFAKNRAPMPPTPGYDLDSLHLVG